ncbi:hypothetical protein ACIBBD_01910 [Streptomyces sp. NPDC051315]|uniref:hypothetical protein n=1 Tax=Streptomyces sp. NPDC051315 TaxID=3365650 RepID=UPI0037A6250C
MPDPRPVEPRRQEGAADIDSLVALGRATPPPIPRPRPDPGPPTADPVDEREAAALTAALAGAGIEAGPADTAAVRALASLDPATVATVEKWLKAKKIDSTGK